MRRPLIHLLLAFITGIIIGSYCTLPYYLLLGTIIVILCLLIVTVRNKWSIMSFILILSFVLLLGVFNIQRQHFFIDPDRDIIRYLDQGKLMMEGTVIESPLAYPDKNILIVRCLRLLKDESYIPVTGNVRLTIPQDLNFQYGDFIRFRSNLKKIRNFNNPGGFDYQRYLKLQGIYATGFIADRSHIVRLRQNTASPIKLHIESFRAHLKQIIDRNAATPQKEIIEAMTLGNQYEIPEEIRDNFNKTGTTHILSISGMHVGMVAATAFFFVFLILKSSQYLMLRFNIIKIAAACAFIMVLLYALIAGMGVTVQRAAIMALIFLIALFSGKQKDLYNTLALAGLIILFISPEALFDISFQLSFLAVLAIIYIVPRCTAYQPKHFSTFPLWMQNITRYLYLTTMVCLAATIGTLPLIMYYFSRVSLITVIANLIIVPLLGTITLSLSMFFILFAFFSPWAAGYFIKLASCFTQISVNIINKLAAIPWSSFNTTRPNILEIALFYFLIFILVEFIDARLKKEKQNNLPVYRRQILKILLMMTVMIFCIDITYLVFKDKFQTGLKITVIDVGQGNSVLVQFPGGKNMLIDGGGFPESTFDVGRTVVAPFLYHKRINHIDTIVLTHPHPDHLVGLIHIMNNFGVREVWTSNLPIDSERFPLWKKAIEENHINIVTVSNKSPGKIINGTTIRVLWPADSSIKDMENDLYDDVNDASLVLKVTFGKVSILFPGDISSDVEKQLIQSKADLRSDILLMPHHGSPYSSSMAFIKAVDCRYAVVSAGSNNVFHHPHPSTIQRYKDSGIEIYRTDRDGATSITTDGNKLKISTFLRHK